jgi:hypothetical protein
MTDLRAEGAADLRPPGATDFRPPAGGATDLREAGGKTDFREAGGGATDFLEELAFAVDLSLFLGMGRGLGPANLGGSVPNPRSVLYLREFSEFR